MQFSTTRGSQSEGAGTEMKQDKAVLTLALLLAPFFLSSIAAAQSAKPTADQNIQLSVFGAASGDYTGLSGGRNLSVTAGTDLALAPWHGTRPPWSCAAPTPSTREPSSPRKMSSVASGWTSSWAVASILTATSSSAAAR
jgi:hypothetical protein